jgi:RNA polymerase sigma-70 factor (ECF subfamily)
MERVRVARLVGAGAGVRQAERGLVSRAVSGEPRAAREIFERHYGGMYARAMRSIGDPVEAEDLVQDAFVRAFGRLDRFDPKYRLSTWLHRIVINSCRDHLKSPRRRERPCGEELDEVSAACDRDSDPMVIDQRGRRLRSALAELRPRYLEIVVLKDMMGLSFEEIHVATGAPITGLKIRAIRARARLRKLLEKAV